jgi:hypothetical protein
MRGIKNQSVNFSNPLTPTLSLRERGLRFCRVSFAHRFPGVYAFQLVGGAHPTKIMLG